MQDASLFVVIARLVVSLAVVLALMVLAARLLNRRGTLGRTMRDAPIRVVARHGLGRNASVTIVRTGDRALVLGVTATAINVLAETDPSAFEPVADADRTSDPGGGIIRPSRTWSDLIETMRERTVRRS